MRRPLDRLAGLDPSGIVGRRAVGAARRLPGVGLGERLVERAEEALLRELGRRLDEAGALRGLPAPRATGSPSAAAPDDPAALMERLLRRSIDQDPAAGERSLVEMVLGELVPDEARMLAALSDGTAFAVIDVIARDGRVLARDISTLGRQAGVVLPDRVPVYLGHMTALGLVERGPEEVRLDDDYDILLTERAAARARADGGSGLRRPRVVKATVRISELGRSVWASTRA